MNVMHKFIVILSSETCAYGTLPRARSVSLRNESLLDLLISKREEAGRACMYTQLSMSGLSSYDNNVDN